MKLVLREYNLKLKHTFTISRESIDFQPSLIVELQNEGFSGFGEATSNPYYKTTVPVMMQDLEKIRNIIESITNETPEDFWAKIHPYLTHDMFALCALDMAYNDLYARQKGKKLYDLWNYTTEKNPLTDYTIGIASIEKMVEKMQELHWPI